MRARIAIAAAIHRDRVVVEIGVPGKRPKTLKPAIRDPGCHPEYSSYLVQGSEAVHIGRINVGAHLDQPHHLVLVAGHARGQEDTSQAEFDLALRQTARQCRLAIRVRLLPTFQLLGPLEHGRVVACVHHRGHSCVLWALGLVIIIMVVVVGALCVILARILFCII